MTALFSREKSHHLAALRMQKTRTVGGFHLFVAQFALTSRAYHNLSAFCASIQVKSVAICAECITHWCVKHRFCKI